MENPTISLSDELNKGRDERSNEEPSPYSRVKILKLVKNPETGERTELPDDTRTRIVESKDNSKLAFILKKKMNDHFSREDDGSEIEIISEPLWSLLKEHLGDHPYHVFRGSSVPLYSPYEAIIFEWDKLQKAAVQEKGDEEERQARDDLKTLLDVISSGSSERGDRPQQFLPWELDCWIYDWNGESFQRTAYTLLFEHFDGQKPLNSLPYRPFGHDIDDESLKHKLVDRGKRFRTLCTAKKGNQLFEYSGDAIFGKKGFSGLVQDEGKRMAQGSEALEVDDIIPGKGKGLVILLYGPPGVGKTSTAETIAQATSKPLFSISVADVGTKARHVEANLGRIFTLATSWKAILLIDEADVFLEKRGIGIAASTDRNALVSVFLRVLEYYQGIMFLTTNQIAQFDAAIPSRIHVSIQYDSLKSDQMAKIFSGFLEPLERKNLIDDYRDIQKWLIEDVYDVGFDGRQIRNIVTTALGLARADGSAKLGKHHLKTVFLNARSFKKEFEVQFDRYIRGQEQLIK
ncbi:hypothetical protein CaCOL14_013176 [Colletotrichum acutatum]